MNLQYFATLGSGTLPHLGYGPVHHLPSGMYPVPNNRHDMRARVGEPSVIINPEDFSVSIGLRQQAITVAGVALPLPAAALEYRRALVLHNNGPGILYIGDSTVTTSNGFPLGVGEKIAFDIQGTPNTLVYGISDGATSVRILELA